MIGEEFKVVAYPLKAVDADHNVPSPVGELVEAAAEIVGDGPAWAHIRLHAPASLRPASQTLAAGCCLAQDHLHVPHLRKHPRLAPDPRLHRVPKTPFWCRNAILLMLFSAVPALLYKYFKCHRRPDLQPRF